MSEKTIIALAGNPNSGKTTLFNALTGGNQYVGNWPGVTVEKKEGKAKGYDDIIIQDLPGIYSLSPYTMEELVARNYLVSDRPEAIINIIDGSNLERNLYLTTQLAELGIPMILAINMMDLVDKNGDKIDADKLEQELGCKVVGISALKKKGIDQLIPYCKEEIAKNKIAKPIEYSPKLQKSLDAIKAIDISGIPQGEENWAAIKLFERDEKFKEALPISADQEKALEDIILSAEKAYDDDSESIVTGERYDFIAKMLKNCYTKKSVEESISDKIDKVVTNRFLALPIFAGVMFLVYYIAVVGIGLKMTDWVNDVFVAEWLQGGATSFLESINASEYTISLVVDGIIAGIGAPLGFAPQMAMVFLFLSILEGIGYMARVAFIMDRIFRHFGLSGKSFISFLVSSGCGVPGIMATRTIENQRDRDMTMMTTTLMPCGAKLPVIAMVAVFIMGSADFWWIAPSIYLFLIAASIISCIILKKTKFFAGDPAPFVMELPPYHLPSVTGVLRQVWIRISSFLKKAGTVIFAMCVVMWFLLTFGIEDGHFAMVDQDKSFLASIGGFIAFFLKPLGFGNWQSGAATLAGFTAKEAILSTMGILAGIGEVEDYDPSMNAQFAAFFPTILAAVSFLIFNLLNSPCLAAVSGLYKEISSTKLFWFAILFQNLGAYLVSLIFYQLVGLAIGEVAFSAWTVVAVVGLAFLLFLIFRPDPNKKKAENERKKYV